MEKEKQVTKPNKSDLSINQYVPEQTSHTEGYKTLPQLKYWVQTVLPQVYDDALSYQELLYKTCAYLNTMNDNNNLMSEDVKTFIQQFNEMVSHVNTELENSEQYINSYFNDLDVTEEIENKLSDMANDGTFNRLWDTKIKNWSENKAGTTTSNWLQNNISGTDTVIIDKSLTVNGAAADAESVGNRFREYIKYNKVICSNKPINIDTVNKNVEIYNTTRFISNSGYIDATEGAYSYDGLDLTNSLTVFVVYDKDSNPNVKVINIDDFRENYKNYDLLFSFIGNIKTGEYNKCSDSRISVDGKSNTINYIKYPEYLSEKPINIDTINKKVTVYPFSRFFSNSGYIQLKAKSEYYETGSPITAFVVVPKNQSVYEKEWLIVNEQRFNDHYPEYDLIFAFYNDINTGEYIKCTLNNIKINSLNNYAKYSEWVMDKVPNFDTTNKTITVYSNIRKYLIPSNIYIELSTNTISYDVTGGNVLFVGAKNPVRTTPTSLEFTDYYVKSFANYNYDEDKYIFFVFYKNQIEQGKYESCTLPRFSINGKTEYDKNNESSDENVIRIKTSGGTSQINLPKTGTYYIYPNDTEAVFDFGNTITTEENKLNGYNKIYYSTSNVVLNNSDQFIFQDSVPDKTTMVNAAEIHPLQNKNTYRCGETKIKRCSSVTLETALDEIENSNDYRYYYDSNNTIYFSRPENVATYKLVQSNGKNLFTGEIKDSTIYMSNVTVKYGTINLIGTVSSEINNCKVCNANDAGGIRLDNSQDAKCIRCETYGTFAGANKTGDGINIHSNTPTNINNVSSSATLIDCWSHDNNDDGFSDHEYCKTTILGGLYEYNKKGGLTPSTGSRDTIYNAISRRNYNGLYYANKPLTNDIQGVVYAYNVIAANNSQSGFRCIDGATMILEDCKAIDNNIGYKIAGNSTMRCTNCVNYNNSKDKEIDTNSNLEVNNYTTYLN